jgi:hypothetical protein
MDLTRRDALRIAWAGFAISRASIAQAQTTGVKALIFDTFGTVVDWRGSIIAEGNAWGKEHGSTID